MFAKFYAIGACIIGAFQVLEAVLAFAVSRKMEDWNYAFASVECLWIPISAIAIFFLTANKKHLISPISFVAYEIIGITISVTLQILDPQPNKNELPMPFVIAGLLFGMFYLITNVRLYKDLIKSN